MHGTRETRAFLVQLTLLSLQLLFSNRQERCVETSYLVLKIGYSSSKCWHDDPVTRTGSKPWLQVRPVYQGRCLHCLSDLLDRAWLATTQPGACGWGSAERLLIIPRLIVIFERPSRQRMRQPHHRLKSNHGMPLGISRTRIISNNLSADYMTAGPQAHKGCPTPGWWDCFFSSFSPRPAAPFLFVSSSCVVHTNSESRTFVFSVIGRLASDSAMGASSRNQASSAC